MKNQNHGELIKQYGSETIIRLLAPYITEKRKQRIESVLNHRLESIQLAIEAPSDINNALAAVRTCEALGISKIHLIQPEGDAIAARKVTQGAIYWVDILLHNTLHDFLAFIKKEDYLIAGGVVTAEQPLSSIPIKKPVCLLIGNEQRGLSQEAQAACDIQYRIPMCGMSESLNLSVSAAISLYDLISRKRQQQKLSDLKQSERLAYQAKYYLNSVEDRLITGLLGPLII